MHYWRVKYYLNILLLYSAISVIVGCGEEEIIRPIICANGLCDFDNQSFDTDNCTWVYFGEHELSDYSKSSFPDFNLSLFDTVSFYHNDLEWIFRVDMKDENKSISSLNTFEPCPCSGDNTLFYCLNTEIRIVRFTSVDNPDDFFKLELYTIPDITDKDLNSVGDQLSIIRNYIVEFVPIIDPKTLSYQSTDNQERIDSVQVGEDYYYDILTNKNLIPSLKSYKYLYSREFGMIAFTDDLGRFWIRELTL